MNIERTNRRDCVRIDGQTWWISGFAADGDRVQLIRIRSDGTATGEDRIVAAGDLP